MTELNQLYKDLLQIKMRDELEKDIKSTPFIVGAGFIIAFMILAVSILML